MRNQRSLLLTSQDSPRSNSAFLTVQIGATSKDIRLEIKSKTSEFLGTQQTSLTTLRVRIERKKPQLKFFVTPGKAMKLSHKSVATLSALSALALSPLFFAGSASAQSVRFDGSYVGGGVGGSVTSGGVSNDEAVFGGNIQGRFAIPNAPVSVRGSVMFNGNNSAIIPSLTYDIPVARNTNVYLGAGYGFVQNQGQTSQIGNQDAPVISAGVESEVAKGVVVYSDAKYGINAYQGSGTGSLSIVGGVGLRF